MRGVQNPGYNLQKFTTNGFHKHLMKRGAINNSKVVMSNAYGAKLPIGAVSNKDVQQVEDSKHINQIYSKKQFMSKRNQLQTSPPPLRT